MRPAVPPYGELLVLGMFAVVALCGLIVMVWAYWKILNRVGYDGRLSLLIFLPGIYQVFVIWVALAHWPKLPWTGGVIRFGERKELRGVTMPGYCTVCGAKFGVGARYCPQCGKPLEV